MSTKRTVINRPRRPTAPDDVTEIFRRLENMPPRLRKTGTFLDEDFRLHRLLNLYSERRCSMFSRESEPPWPPEYVAHNDWHRVRQVRLVARGNPRRGVMHEPEPISLSDEQLSVVTRFAEPLAPPDRSAFLAALANTLRHEPRPVGDGAVHRAVRELLATASTSDPTPWPLAAARGRHGTMVHRSCATARRSAERGASEPMGDPGQLSQITSTAAAASLPVPSYPRAREF
jgi:hypothetical protein